MSKRQFIVVFLLLGIAIAAALIFSAQNDEPSYQGHHLDWWVDQYGGFKNFQPVPNADEALSTFGTNALPYLLNWIRNVDEQPSQTRRSVATILRHMPKLLEPGFLVSWADENAFRKHTGERAWSAAVAFSALGTNAEPAIPTLKAMVTNPTNGTACIVAERALARIGPDGFAAVLDVISTPELPQRGALMQGDSLAPHIRAPDEMTVVGQADPNYRINSKRAAPVLLKCAEDSDPHIRRLAFLLLSYSDPVTMVPALTNFLSKSPPPPEIRRQATDALAKHGKDAVVAVPFLLARYGSSDPEIRVEASNALIQIAPEALAKSHPQ